MANTLTLNSSEGVGAQQFQGLYSDIWKVKATVTDHDAVAINDTLAMTITVPNVTLGDHVISAAINMDLSDGTDQASYQFEVTADNTVTMYIHADVGEFAADAITGAVAKVLIGRPAW